MRQRTVVGRARAESAGTVIAQSSKRQAPNSRKAPSPKHELAPIEGAFEFGDLKVLWGLVLGGWSFSSSGLRHQVLLDEVFVQGDAKSRPVRHCDPAVFGLQFFPRQIVTHRRVIDTILEDESVAAG